MEDNTILESIENDDFYKKFLQTSVRSNLLTTLSITEQVKKLGDGIDALSKELNAQVLEKHNDLLRQANHATKLQDILNTMNLHVQNLYANAERLKLQIHGPYSALEKHTKMLSRLHLASHILRQVNRMQQLSKRLSNTNDPIQKATILQELEQLAADPELSDIDAITLELRNIKEQHQNIVKTTNTMLHQSVVNENMIQTTTALQIFINMGIIKTAIQNAIDISLSECRESLKASFDLNVNITGNLNKNKVGPGKANLSSSQGFRSRIWVDLEKAFSEEIYKQCRQIKFLETTLNNMNVIVEQNEISPDFWNQLSKCIKEEIENSNSAVQQMLEDDYPKLLKCYYEMTLKLNYNNFKFDRSIFEKCENSYLSSSLNRILEPTQNMFNNELNTPSHDQIDSLIRLITTELSVTLVEHNLNEKIAKNISKCIKLYGVKTEQQIVTGPEAAQVVGGAVNSGQQHNIQLANSMYYFQVQIQRILSNMKDSLPIESVVSINETLSSLDNLTGSILDPLIDSVKLTVETIIITIHIETDWTKLQIPPTKSTQSCSPYMRELVQFITRSYQTYLSPFSNKECLTQKCHSIAMRCIDLLVRHTSILRPISQGGRLRLQADFNHLEQALKVICPHLFDLGHPYRLLKSMATLIIQSPTDIVASQDSGSSIPHSTVLFLLFSYAGSELASPHQNTGWTIQKLSTWLDEHVSEYERLDLIAGALQRYVTLIRQKNSINFDPIYPIMSEFIEKAIKSCN
ncbi:conserved oligomeric Golgi complex subunit 5 [Onthophagus taurus]|uniref:conserved oligomeric Golgi complex subunit 5 n=1 Tax=Onthophagus taurus TaxID=166361 RepID=UPI000C20625C|nr:conserved oligomeric Golgi complex subunit 5 [Onthophagus taurus]